MKPYKVALIQQETQIIVDPKQRDAIVKRNVDRVLELIDYSKIRLGAVKLAVFSEYGIIAQYRPRSVDEWLALAETVPGDVTAMLGKKARQTGCYIAGNVYERNADWPGRLFNTSFIVSPENGEVILAYRKHNGPNNLNTTYTGPGDVYSEYIRRYGENALFPVVDTDIGRLACMSCTDIVFPEMARALALKGAEVLIHPTAEPYAPEGPVWDALRRARAYENLCYLLSTNCGAMLGSNRPSSGYRGGTQAIDPMGEVLGEIPGAGEALVTATIDIDRLRTLRTAKPESGHVWNSLVSLRTDLFAKVYADAKRWPNDAWHDRAIKSTDETRRLAGEIIEDLISRNLLIVPN